MEEELTTIRETVHRAAIKLSPHPRHKGAAGSPSAPSRNGGSDGGGNGVTQDLNGVMERLHHLENERKVSFRICCCFGSGYACFGFRICCCFWSGYVVVILGQDMLDLLCQLFLHNLLLFCGLC